MQEATPLDWQALSALYDEAQALQPSERAAWLAGLEANGHALAPHLRRMLAVPDGFLTALPDFACAGSEEGKPAASLELQAQAGERIGAYRLLRPLGAGGMAEVWLAERADGVFERQVALKLLTAQGGTSRTRNFQRRFEREHRILAALRHEHIAALFDAGVTADGQHWLALEYVDGQAIDAWCDSRRLGLRQRVALFGQVLQAVAHAHARLVLHRDLKPSNVLVTEAGQVRLLDFGIATLLDDEPDGAASELTRVGGRPMTPRYASPEQLQGLPMDTTSDVYTLGVMLYELLCGQPPHAPIAPGTGALALAVLAGETLPPSRQIPTAEALAARGLHVTAWRRQLAGELDAIVLRAMALKSEDRYGSADALAADLARWLAGEPVQAQLPGPLQRVWKFSRRHPWGTGLGMAAVLALAIATGLAAVSASRANEEAARARQASGFMLRLFEDADPDRHRGQALSPGQLLVRGRDRLLADAGISVLLKSDLLEGIGRAQNDMGAYDEADTTYAQWLVICQPGCPAAQRAWAYTLRAENELRRAQFKQATGWLQQADTALAPSQDASALQAKRHEVRGWLASYAGQFDDAESAFARGIEALLPGADQQAADLWQARARNAAERKDPASAISSLDRAAPHVAVIARARPSAAHNFAQARAEVLVQLGQYGRLREVAATDINACDAGLQPLSQACRVLRSYAAAALLRLGDDKSVDSWELMRSADAASTDAQRLNALVWAHRAAWQSGDVTAMQHTKARLRGVLDAGSSPRARVRALLALGEGSLSERKPQLALVQLGQAQALLLESAWGNSYLAASVRLTEGLAWQLVGQVETALAAFGKAQETIDAELGATHPLALWMSLNQVRPWCALGQLARARARVDAALPTLQRVWGDSAPAVRRAEELRREVAAASNGRGGCAVAGFHPFH